MEYKMDKTQEIDNLLRQYNQTHISNLMHKLEEDKKQEEKSGTSEIMLGNGSTSTMKEPVVIPSAMSSNQQKKIITNNIQSINNQVEDDSFDELNDFDPIESTSDIDEITDSVKLKKDSYRI